MARHKFSVGQVVDFAEPRLSTPIIGRYEITRLLPSDGIQFQYRIKTRMAKIFSRRRKQVAKEVVTVRE